jgi:hypothetical protein
MLLKAKLGSLCGTDFTEKRYIFRSIQRKTGSVIILLILLVLLDLPMLLLKKKKKIKNKKKKKKKKKKETAIDGLS